MAKKADKKPKNDEKYTDILEEYFMEDGIEKVKRTYMNGNKFVKEEIINN